MLPQKMWKTLWKSRQLVAQVPVKYGRTASCTTMVRAARAGISSAPAEQSLHRRPAIANSQRSQKNIAPASVNDVPPG
jgi:hypothetical protein